MQFPIMSFVVLVGSLLVGWPTQAAVKAEMAALLSQVPTLATETKGELSLTQLQERARSITVKVISGQGWGSGILLKKQGQVYTILTNAHVLRIGNSYQIQTPDGEIHAAQPITGVKFQDDDLALLSFRSAKNYAIATIANSRSLAVGEPAFAAGFPENGQGLLFTNGQLNYVSPQAFVGGYQLAYSNDILKGMSGGPMLSRRGELVAINGKHKHPLWGNSYIYKDGSTPIAKIRQQLEYSSWAIPIQTFLQFVPQFTSQVTSRKPTPTVELPIPVAPKPDVMMGEPIQQQNQQIPRHSFW